MRNGTTSLALALAFGAMLAGGGEVRGAEATPPRPTATAAVKATTPVPGAGATANEAHAAALRGLDWFVANADGMELDFAVKNAEKFRRVAADEGIRRRMDALVKGRLAEVPKAAAALEAQDRKGSGWFSIRKPVQDLLLMKAAGHPWKADAERLAQLFAQKGEALLPPRTMPSQRLIAARQLRQLGLPTGEIYRETVAAIRAEPPASRLAEGKRGVMSLSARTHVVFTMSDYYARTLAPADFAYEIDAFARALEELAGREQLDDVTADIASEVLTARKVLRLPPDARTNAVQKHLLAMQNADGSWGGEEQSNAKVHHTAMAILALMEFGAEFQVGIDVL